MKRITFNDERGKRIQLYLNHKAYFDDRIRQHPKFKRANKADIAIDYLTTDHTLGEVGATYHISKARVHQHTSDFLRMIMRIYERNKKELDYQPIVVLPEKKQDNTERIKEVIGYLRQDKGKLAHQLHLLENRIDLLEQELGFREPRKFFSVKRDYLVAGDNRRAEISGDEFDGGGDRRTHEYKSQLQLIDDNGTKGYLLSNLKSHLGTSYQDFFSWYQQKHYTGGVYEGEYYFLKEHVDEYLHSQHPVLTETI